MSGSTLSFMRQEALRREIIARLDKAESAAQAMKGPKRKIPDYHDKVRMGKTRKDHQSGAHERHINNKIAEANFHRSGDPKDRPTHYNGKAQFFRAVTFKGNQRKMVDRIGKHPVGK